MMAVMAPSFPSNMSVTVATISLGISGAGLSLASPIVSSSAGRVPGKRNNFYSTPQIPHTHYQSPGMLPADSLSFVTSFGYSGYFIGPPLFGGLAELLGSLRWSLLVGKAFLYFNKNIH